MPSRLPWARNGPGAERFVLERRIAVGVIATMVDSRLEWYPKLMEMAGTIIEEDFSSRTIISGQTTTLDVEWWLSERDQSINYSTIYMVPAECLHPERERL